MEEDYTFEQNYKELIDNARRLGHKTFQIHETDIIVRGQAYLVSLVVKKLQHRNLKILLHNLKNNTFKITMVHVSDANPVGAFVDFEQFFSLKHSLEIRWREQIKKITKKLNVVIIHFKVIFDTLTVNDPVEELAPMFVHDKRFVSEETRQKIGDAHRGMIYKTKRTEGILWHWVGNRKYWI